MKYSFIIITFCFLFFVPKIANSQNILTGIIIDNNTKEPIPFANVVVEKSVRGTVSGFDGTFALQRRSYDNSFKISSIGYETKTINIEQSVNFVTITMIPKRYEINQVTVYPGENPALTIMKKVFENRDINNADVATDYKCLIYHKMIFAYDTDSARMMSYLSSMPFIPKAALDTLDVNEFSKKMDKTHVILIESVSEKKHLAPDKDFERVISGRTSGFRDPILSTVPAQMQSFTFYKDYMMLLDNYLMNPVSKAGLQRYFFNIEDTVLDARNDTLFYISFRPRKNSNIKGMTGSMHIHIPTYGIKTVSASTNEKDYDFSIKQTYQYIDDKQWFPEYLESKLELKIMMPMLVSSKSTVTAIELSPELSKKDFSSVSLIDESLKNNIPIENFRLQPLTAKDSLTYQLMDSIFISNNMDLFMVNYMKILMQSGINIGPFLLDIGKTINFNNYDGTNLGLGLWTNDKVMRNLSIGGFYYYSFKPKDHNYGAGLKFNISQKHETSLHFQWEKRNLSTGTFELLNANDGILYGDWSIFLTKVKDPTNKTSFSFTTRFLNYFKTNLFYQYSEVSPATVYPYMAGDSIPVSPFFYHEYGIKLKWAHKETFTYLYPFGLMSNGTNWPILWTNLCFGSTSKINNYSHLKLEVQLEKQIRVHETYKSTIKVAGANIWGDAPVAKLYSLMGLYMGKWNLDMPNYFKIMRPNEFAASRFVNVFWYNTFFTRLNNPKKFKPEITISTSAGWGDVIGNYPLNIKTYNKGYYESGLFFGNLMKVWVFKYGLGIHYRYGPYSLPKQIDNWGITFGLGGAF